MLTLASFVSNNVPAQCVSKLSSELKQEILKAGHRPDKPGDEEIDLEVQFVQLILVEDDSDMLLTEDNKPDEYQAVLEKTPANTTYKDILPTESIGHTVLLRGRAGVGKTTLVQWLLTQWALNMWAVHCCCAFMLNLRYLMEHTYTISLPDLLTTCSLYAVGQSHSTLREWMSNCQEQLIIFIGKVTLHIPVSLYMTVLSKYYELSLIVTR